MIVVCDVMVVRVGACNKDVSVTDYGVFYWPRTTHSQRAEFRCPYGGLSASAAGTATAYRWCNATNNGLVEWTRPDYSNCSTVNSVSVCLEQQQESLG